MKRLLLFWLCLLPLLVAAQSVSVPSELQFAGLRLLLTDKGRAAVQQKVDALRRHPTSFQSRVALADAAFPVIDRVLQEQGVPVDFRYLSLQESGLQGDAQSIHDAVGYWQFKREAATDFGLLVNDDVDERKHLVAATRGAAQYLLRSQRMYQNWLHTLLSYNLGPGGVKPYTLPTDAKATEMEITEKTHPYVLTFLAHKIAYEPAVGANPRPAMLLREFPAPAGQPLAVLAQAIQTDPAELAKHNRWLLAAAVPTDKAYTALVPVTDSLQLLAMTVQQGANASKLITKPATDAHNAAFVTVNGLRAVVALPGESKEELASRGGIKLRKFLSFNNLKAFDNIVVGQTYFLQRKRDKAAVEYHVAQTGETVEAISQQYGVRTKAIRSKNRMSFNEALQPGRLLWMQHTRPREVAVEYVKDQNGAVTAAIERPLGTPAPLTRRATTPRPDTTKPIGTASTTDTANSSAEPAASTELSTAGATDSVAAPVASPDSAADNISEATTEPVPAPAAAPKTTDRTVYSGSAPKKPLPPSAPVADEPATAANEEEPVAAPTPATTATTTPASTGPGSVWAPLPDAPPTKKPAPASAPAPAAPKSAPAPKAPASTAAVPPAKAPAPSPAPASPTKPPVATPAPAPTATAVEPIPADGLHVVEKKENLYSIGRRFGLRPADIVAWNNLPPNPSLRIGQVLRVAPTAATAPTSATASAKPAPAAAAPAVAPKPVTTTPSTAPASSSVPVAAATGPVKHTVAVGESMYGISRKYGVTIKEIMEWNGKPDFNVRPGEVLVIRPSK